MCSVYAPEFFTAGDREVSLEREGPTPVAEWPRRDYSRLGAIVTRQFSLWPFGTRAVRLFLLVDPLDRDGALVQGVLRAMQQEYFRSETRSQTTALRSTLLAAHYALRHHNRDALPHDRVVASAACAVARGSRVYVALAGEATALAWTGGELHIQRANSRTSRPLGAESLPRIAFWSTSLDAQGQLALACGAAWQDSTSETIRTLFASATPDAAPYLLAEALSGSEGPARVLVGPALSQTQSGLPHAAPPSPPRQPSLRPPDRAARSGRVAGPRPRARWSSPFLDARAFRRVLLPTAIVAALLLAATLTGRPFGTPAHLAHAERAESLLAESARASDPYQARALALSARDLARQAEAAQPSEHGALVQRVERTLQTLDRVYHVTPTLLVDLPNASARISDLVLGDRTLYALDAAAGAVHRFDSTASAQQPGPSTILLQSGTSVGGATLDRPVALAWLPGPSGSLLALDRGRTLLRYTPANRLLTTLPGLAGEWQSIGAMVSCSGALCLLDSAAGSLLRFPFGPTAEPLPPVEILSARRTGLPLDRAVELLALKELYVRQTDGVVQRVDWGGAPQPFSVSPPDAPLGKVTGMASDRTDGLYLADPINARLVHVSADGRYIRQIRTTGPVSLAGLTSLQTSEDGKHLYALTADGIMALALPPDILPPFDPPAQSDSAPGPTTLGK